jgi:hypothetical protein
MCNWKRRNSVESFAASVGKLLALLKVENANGLRQCIAQLRLEKMLDVVMNVRCLEPRLGDELRWCEMRPNDGVATGCEAGKASRHSDAVPRAVVSDKSLIFGRHSKRVVERPNDPHSATRHAGRHDGNRDAMAGLEAMVG